MGRRICFDRELVCIHIHEDKHEVVIVTLTRNIIIEGYKKVTITNVIGRQEVIK